MPFAESAYVPSPPSASTPAKSTRKKKEDQAPTQVTTITGGLLGGVNLGTLPDYSPPAPTTTNTTTSKSGSGGGGTGSTSSPTTGGGTTTPPSSGGTTTSTDITKAMYEALLPYLSPDDRQRLISTAYIQGIELNVPGINYSSLIPGTSQNSNTSSYKVNPDYLVPSDTRKPINIEALVTGGNYSLQWIRDLIDTGRYYITDPQNVNMVELAGKTYDPNTVLSKSAPVVSFQATDSRNPGEQPSLSQQNQALSIIPSELKGSTRGYFAGSQRAEGITTALENMAAAAGKTPAELGAGYRFLQEVASNLRRFSPASGPMSRQQYVELLGQIKPLLDNAPSGYGELGRMLALPFFSSGNLFNVAQNQAGQYLFGEENKRLFR